MTFSFIVVCLLLTLNSRVSTRKPFRGIVYHISALKRQRRKKILAKILGRIFPAQEAPPKFQGRFLRRRKSRQKFHGSSRDAGRAAEFLKLPVSAVLGVIWRDWFRFFVMFAALRGNGHYPLARPSGRLRRGTLRSEASTVHLRAASLPIGMSFSLPYRFLSFC